MADKPLKSLNGRKFAGVLAKPIDAGIIFPLGRKDLWQEFQDRRWAELRRQRMAKMPHLARHLGIQFEHLDLTSHADLLSFYGCVAENLAMLLIPGFQEKRPGKWPAETLMQVLVTIEKGKQAGFFASDLAGCMACLKQLDSSLARPANRTHLKARAMTLQNRVSQLRAKLKREHAAKKVLHKKPSLRIVK